MAELTDDITVLAVSVSEAILEAKKLLKWGKCNSDIETSLTISSY